MECTLYRRKIREKRGTDEKNSFRECIRKKNFGLRLTAVTLAVIVMGFSLSLLVLVDLGTDPCTSMNLPFLEKLGMGIGNWQALLNTGHIYFCHFFRQENIGFGTLANMFLVGYSLQFFPGYGKRHCRWDCLTRWQCVF